MKRLLLITLVACGGTQQPPATAVENSAPPSQAEAPRGDAREIERTQQGGTIELSGHRDAAWRVAKEAMTRHCGEDAYVVTQEGEEAVTDTTGKLVATAWRVHYVCSAPAP